MVKDVRKKNSMIISALDIFSYTWIQPKKLRRMSETFRMHLLLKQKVLDAESSLPKEGSPAKALFPKPIYIHFFFANLLIFV